MSVYVWIKALHLAAAMLFVGGVLVEAVALWAFAALGPLQRSIIAAVRIVRRVDAAVTTPAMLAVWVLGITLALNGGWMKSHWLALKLVFVVLLSGLHGIQSGALRRLATRGPLPQNRMRAISIPLIAGIVLIIALLVILKPF